MLYQRNVDGNGNRNVSPVANAGLKAGLSYEGRRGLTARVFDVFEGGVNGSAYGGNVNPFPGAHHVVNGHIRYNLAKYLPFAARYGAAAVIHANNLTNHQVWLPAGLYTPDTIPVQQGRVIYAGLEISALRD